MLKKSTKITSLVVAAATVATMVPAMAADKVADKEGTIYNAVAYKDGQFYIDGDDIADNDDNDGVYWLKDGKYSEVDDDIDSGDEITDNAYGEKYIEFGDGDYYLDLTNGKLTDDFLKGDDREDAASALKKKVRKDDPSRYTEDSRTTQAGVDVKDTENYNDEEIWEIPSNKFIKPYYQTKHYKFESGKADYVLDIDAAGNITTAASATVYTDENGKYIDADNDLGKVNLVIGNEVIDFDEVGTESNKAKTKDYVLGIRHGRTLGSDDNYIYRKAYLYVGYMETVTVDGKDQKQAKYFDTVLKEYDQNGNPIGNEKQFLLDNEGNKVQFGSVKNPITPEVQNDGSFVVIQKISKEQGDDKDDAILPKSTQTYFVNEYKAYDDKYKKAEYKADFFNKFTADFNECAAGISVVDGRLNSYGIKNDDDEKFGAVTLTLESKNGFYYVGQSDSDFTIDDDEEFAFDVDVDGNVWTLNHGKINKYTKGDFGDAIYKVDGGYNELSVYDENNLIAYNEDDERYAIVGGKSSTGKYEVENEETTTETTTTAQAGWVQDATTGSWSYVKADGTKAIGWFQSPTSGLWYYMDANGVMQANGWIQDGGSWYYLKADGAMATGWVYTGGAWYFLKNTAGNMGAMQTGWIQTGGKWYYCNASGAMLSNTTVDGYVLGADGAWIK